MHKEVLIYVLHSQLKLASMNIIKLLLQSTLLTWLDTYAKNIIFCCLAFLSTLQVLGGGINIDPNSVTLNGYKCGAFFLPGARVLMKYNATDYSYSGGNYKYFVFRFTINVSIKQSVGRNGINEGLDVMKIQQALKAMGFYSEAVDGVLTDAVVNSISSFQKSIGMTTDGRVDPNGITIKYLSKVKPIYFLQAVSDHVSRDDHEFAFALNLKLPNLPGKYSLSYHRFPIFAFTALGIKEEGNEVLLNEIAQREIQEHLSQYPHEFLDLCTVNIGSQETVTPELYLQVNGKVPGQQKLKLGTAPLLFRWYTKNMPKAAPVLYRFRLYPAQEWSYWQSNNTTEFYILNTGTYEFQVEAKYKVDGEEKVTNQARYSFYIEQPFLAEPDDNSTLKSDEITFIDKGDVVRSTKDPQEVIRQVYDNSTALVIGVDSYDDQTWQSLPYINNDLQAVGTAFSNLGFTVKAPKAKKRGEIIEAIRSTIMSASQNDRLIIYISSHGFLDLITNKPMVACKDCFKSSPTNCLNIAELKDLIKGAEKKIRHILLILDCCTSGVGVIDKSNALGAMKSLATQGGIHVLAAGLGDQNAKMAHQFRMSVFTYFLTKGLKNKAADYTKDGIITLTELLIYIQYNVATYTKSEQVPSWGRVSGFGEMIFN